MIAKSKKAPPLTRFLNRFFGESATNNPNKTVTASPYERGFPLSGNNVIQALGAPELSFPGAVGVGSQTIYGVQKQAIVYGKPDQGGYFQLGGGWSYSGLDAPPQGRFFSTDQA